jgi:hypothetical protein
MSPPNDYLDPNYVSEFKPMSIADIGKRPEPPAPEPEPPTPQSDAADLLEQMRKSNA